MYPTCKIIPLKSGGINEMSVPFISINWHESNLNFGNTGSLAQRERLWMCRAHCTRTTWYRMTFIKCRKSAQFIDYMFTWKFQFQVILNCGNTCTGNPHGVLMSWTVSAVQSTDQVDLATALGEKSALTGIYVLYKVNATMVGGLYGQAAALFQSFFSEFSN